MQNTTHWGKIEATRSLVLCCFSSSKHANERWFFQPSLTFSPLKGELPEGEGKDLKYYNTAVIFDDAGKLISTYRKCHIPQDPGFYEKDYFSAGGRIEVINTKLGKICVMICFDQWFPEAARLATLQGAQLIVYPTAIGMPDKVENLTGDWREMWQTAQCGHAACNNVYVAAVNRVGKESSGSNTTTFFGGTFIADYAGHVIAQADMEENIVMAECDFKRQKAVQEAWCFLPNRKTLLYSPLSESKYTHSSDVE